MILPQLRNLQQLSVSSDIDRLYKIFSTGSGSVTATGRALGAGSAPHGIYPAVEPAAAQRQL